MLPVRSIAEAVPHHSRVAKIQMLKLIMTTPRSALQAALATAAMLLALASALEPVQAATPDSMLESGKAQGKIPTQIFQPFGARGDAGFEDRCSPGQYLVGLRGRAGAWIDQITIVCSANNGNGQLTGYVNGPSRGGNGGGPDESLCKAGETIYTVLPVLTGDGRQVQELVGNCRAVGKKSGTFLRVGNVANSNQPRQRFSCGEGEAATGLTGRYGKHVNAIGLICSRLVINQPNVQAENAALDASMEAVEFNIDMPGNDFKNYPSSIFTQCRRDCARDPACKAWTWVKPGLQGPSARCWLKNAVPPRKPGQGLASGVKKEFRQPR